MPGRTKPRIALALQGGGALGAYHIGAYQALAEADLHPEWITGISIGAINAAILAGNPPQHRVERLDAFWQAISRPEVPIPEAASVWRSLGSYAEALTLGQPNFFQPRLINPWLIPNAPTTEVSFYDTSPLLPTLSRYADFDLINQGHTRLSLGATRVLAGDLVFFDNTVQPIRAENVLASCSLPPGFPATEIDGTLYWDGGCVSNTPLDAIVASPLQSDTVVFLLDLWSQAGPAPTSVNDVLWRVKQIQYADRTAAEIEAAAAQVNLRQAWTPLSDSPEPAAGSEASGQALLDLVHVVYRPEPGPIANSDADFSRASIAERRQAGYRDMQATLDVAPWLCPRHASLRAMVHCVVGGQCEPPAEPGRRARTRHLGRRNIPDSPHQ